MRQQKNKTLSAADWLRIHAKRALLARVADRLQARIIRLETTLQMLRERLQRIIDLKRTAERLSFIHRGVGFIDDGHAISCLDDSIGRTAEIYLNAHDRRHWGLRLFAPKNSQWGREEFYCGPYWGTYDRALAAAVTWILDGTIPPDNGGLPRDPSAQERLDHVFDIPFVPDIDHRPHDRRRRVAPALLEEKTR